MLRGRGLPPDSVSALALKDKLSCPHRVLLVDDFRSSRMCCACHRPRGGLRLPGWAFESTWNYDPPCLDRRELVIMPGPQRQASEQCDNCVKSGVGAPACTGPTAIPPSYGVWLCQTQSCYRVLWQRDVNAAINIMVIIAHWLHGLPKPAAFQRRHEQVAAGLAAQQAHAERQWLAHVAAQELGLPEHTAAAAFHAAAQHARRAWRT